jgi:hypothetical protein
MNAATPIKPADDHIAGDAWIVDAWVYGDYPQEQVVVRATRGDESRDYHFVLDAHQARALGRRLLDLGDLLEDCR